jgi:short-subunit dehydrogenase
VTVISSEASLRGKAVFITGVSSGIGRALALEFARQGAQVAGIARREDRLAALEVEIKAIDGEFLGIGADVTDAAVVRAAVNQAAAHFGRLDILVANAGLGQRGPIVDAEWQDIETVLRTNIDGVYHSIRAAVPHLRKSSDGHIIIISSVVFNLVAPYTATYAASKAFVSSLARSLRLEIDPVAVTDVLVGRTETEFNDKRLGAGKRSNSGGSGKTLRFVPVMTVERVAQAVVRAASSQRKPKRVVVRLFDRLLIWANVLVPDFIGRLARRQYR